MIPDDQVIRFMTEIARDIGEVKSSVKSIEAQGLVNTKDLKIHLADPEAHGGKVRANLLGAIATVIALALSAAALFK